MAVALLLELAKFTLFLGDPRFGHSLKIHDRHVLIFGEL